MADEILEKLSDLKASQSEILANQANQQRILDKQSALLEQHSEILLRNTVTVEEHHRRSTMLEKEIKRIDVDVSEVKEHVNQVRGVGQFFKYASYVAAGLAAVGSMLWGLFTILKQLGL